MLLPGRSGSETAARYAIGMKGLMRLVLAGAAATHFTAPGRELEALRDGPEAYRRWMLACADAIFADIRGGVRTALSDDPHARYHPRPWPEPPFLPRLR